MLHFSTGFVGEVSDAGNAGDSNVGDAEADGDADAETDDAGGR